MLVNISRGYKYTRHTNTHINACGKHKIDGEEISGSAHSGVGSVVKTTSIRMRNVKSCVAAIGEVALCKKEIIIILVTQQFFFSFPYLSSSILALSSNGLTRLF